MARKFKYDNNEYDLDEVKRLALSNWKGTDKDYEALLDNLQGMTEDEGSYADLDKINFTSNFAKTPGKFGKNREDSKHYRRAVGHILRTLQSMTPYTEPAPETPAKQKLNAKGLGQQIFNARGDMSTLTDAEKLQAERENIDRIMKLYDWNDSDKYELEEGYTLQDLQGLLKKALEALNTAEITDDNYPYYKLGIQGPLYKVPEKKQEEISEDSYWNVYKQLGGTREKYEQFWMPYLHQNGMSPIDLQFAQYLRLNDDQISRLNQQNLEYSNYNLDRDFDKYFGQWNHPFWTKADIDITKLIESNQIETTPITHSVGGKKKQYLMVQKNDKEIYAYDPSITGENKMVILDIKPTTIVKSSKKGGYLQTLRK